MTNLFWKQPVGLKKQCRLVVSCLGILLLLLDWQNCPAAVTNVVNSVSSIDLAHPSLVTGTLYEFGSNRKKVIFHFRRTATQVGDAIQVEQLFTLPDGSVACRERILYRANQLVTYDTEDLRADVRGSIVIGPDPKNPKRERVSLEQIQGQNPGAKILKGVEPLQPNTLISDTIYPFILGHWDELMNGSAVKFRLVSLDPPTTFAFKVVKDSESTRSGQPVVVIKMELGNVILAHLMRPIYFTIEKAAPHRVFSYIGRTTPRDKVGGAWKFIDAEVVVDWPETAGNTPQ